jgi:Zn-dependent metalloprotease
MGSKIKNYINVNNSLGNGLPNNAYASPNYFMVFGLGDGTNYSPLVSLDVTGHEFSHMVIRKTANLIYQNESGALNESFADIFGTAIEFYGSPSTANWKIGEKIHI